MRVSFDLDEVLFVNPEKYETEPAPRFPLNILFPERLRKGAPELIRQLQREGFEVWIYTSSFRTETYLKALFRQYGVRFDQVVNGLRHQKEVQRNRKQVPTKLPSFYHIGLHIDDEDAVIQNGRAHGFKTLRVFEPDPDWQEKILREARRLRELSSR